MIKLTIESSVIRRRKNGNIRGMMGGFICEEETEK